MKTRAQRQEMIVDISTQRSEKSSESVVESLTMPSDQGDYE